MEKSARIFVAGHRGLVGSAIVRRLRADGFENLVLAGRDTLDLRVQGDVNDFFEGHRPEFVFLAAAKVGGILANCTYPADFLRDNLAIQTNVIDAAYRNGAEKLLFLGSSCIYPKFAPQPIREDSLLTGPLEPTNEWYAIAKIAGIKMCQAYRAQYGFRAISLMPTNLYGPGDNFDLQSSHVLPALMRKFHEAKVLSAAEVAVWGSGSPRREFLYVDDLADAALFLMREYDSAEIVNVGVGEDLTIRELAEMIQRVTGFEGKLVFDASKPDGTPRKLLDVSRVSGLGWKARMGLERGIEETYRWYLEQGDLGQGRQAAP
ncbi:MAG TPA: GDP-L-fucose synthase [Bryobacteraceae bacterium]|jgi:GDP-L-fucose synthase